MYHSYHYQQQNSISLHQNANNINNNFCNNCGKLGHMYHQCKLPITSYGIVLFSYTEETGIQYLMIRRKDTFGFIDIIRGKFSFNNIEQIQTSIDQMSTLEKQRIISFSFDDLWKTMWGNEGKTQPQFRSEEITSCKKFEILKSGIKNNQDFVDLQGLVEKSTTEWVETEWEFPKGRRNYQEKDIDCALREFEEETGISKNDIAVVENVLPFEEIFVGSNHKIYKHKYFLAYMDKNKHTENLMNFQKTEVSKMEWKTCEACLKSIRPYHLEKKQLIIDINKVLQDYRLYK